MKTIIIATCLALLLMVGCTGDFILEESTFIEGSDSDLQAKPNVNKIEVRIADNQFEPNTILVNQGEIVELQFMLKEPIMFSLPDFEISDLVNTNHLTFEADKRGTFEYFCADCEEKVSGVLKVI